jgi:hypothetical protein
MCLWSQVIQDFKICFLFIQIFLCMFMQVFLQILCDFCFTRLGLGFLCVGSEYIFLNCQNFNLVLCCVITRFNFCSRTRFICVLHGSLTQQVVVLCYACFFAKFVFVLFLLQQSRSCNLGGHFLLVLPNDFEVFEFCFHPSLPKDLNPSGAFVYPKHGVGWWKREHHQWRTLPLPQKVALLLCRTLKAKQFPNQDFI